MRVVEALQTLRKPQGPRGGPVALPADGAELVVRIDRWLAQPTVSHARAMEQVFRSADPLQVHLVRSRLEMAGIECFLANEHAGGSFDLDEATAGAEVWIRDERDHERPRTIVEDARAGFRATLDEAPESGRLLGSRKAWKVLAICWLALLGAGYALSIIVGW